MVGGTAGLCKWEPHHCRRGGFMTEASGAQRRGSLQRMGEAEGAGGASSIQIRAKWGGGDKGVRKAAKGGGQQRQSVICCGAGKG